MITSLIALTHRKKNTSPSEQELFWLWDEIYMLAMMEFGSEDENLRMIEITEHIKD